MKGVVFLCTAILLQFAAAYPSRASNACDSGASFVPNPENCNQFIQCNNGQVHTCSQGLHFDEILGFCVTPDLANCDRESQVPEVSEQPEQPDVPQPPEQTEQPEQPAETDTAEPGETVTEQPGETDTEQPDETDTEQPNETVTEQPGETDTEQPDETDTEQPDEIGTEPDDEVTEQPDETEVTEQSEETEATTEPPQKPKPQPHPDCPTENGSEEGVYLTHETDCNLFYQCDWGLGVVQKCPPGLFFNPSLSVCDWAKNVDCPNV